MKTTIDIPDIIYRKVKAKSAIEGRPVRDVAITLFSSWVDRHEAPLPHAEEKASKISSPPEPSWFGCLRKHAHNAAGRYDMVSVRRSVARGRAVEEQRS